MEQGVVKQVETPRTTFCAELETTGLRLMRGECGSKLKVMQS